MDERDLDERLAAMAALGDPVRRSLFRFVAAQDHPVSRDEAAVVVGASRSVAAFHLDRLVDEGLLETEYRRLSGRRGPGAGRPSKLYRPPAEEVGVSVPPRQYVLAADLLASALLASAETGSAADVAVERVARERGSALAQSVDIPASASTQDVVAAAVDVLARAGYEPSAKASEIVLTNCPFHALAADYTQLVCGMNLALLRGFVEALPAAALTARLDPVPGRCCVRVQLAHDVRQEELP